MARGAIETFRALNDVNSDPENAPRRPTLRELAKLANCSHVTVSLALRNDPRISASTRKRIGALAKRAGYRPDPHLAGLMDYLRASRARASQAVVAVIDFVHANYGEKGSPTTRRFLVGAGARAKKLGFKLERFLIGPEGLTMERLDGILKTRNIRGVLMAPATRARTKLTLDWSRLAAVELGRSLVEPVMHRACNHQAHTMQLALDALAARGYRRCGIYLTEGICARVDQTWLSTYLLHWHRAHTGTLPIPPLIRPDWNEAEFTAWFRTHKPDAVVTINPPVLGWLRAARAAIPQKTGFALLDWSKEMGDVAGVDQNTENVGAAALELVVAQLAQHEYGVPRNPKTVLIEGSWRDGATTRRPLSS